MVKSKPEGFGWWTDYVIRLHNAYHYSMDFILNELNMIDGWLLYSWSLSNDPVSRFSGIQMRNSPTALEADILLEQLKQMKERSNK